jgi:hypothetical protein
MILSKLQMDALKLVLQACADEFPQALPAYEQIEDLKAELTAAHAELDAAEKRIAELEGRL